MAVDAAPSGKAPPGRSRFGAATRALAKTPGLGWQCFGGTDVAGVEVEEGDAAWVDTRERLVNDEGAI